MIILPMFAFGFASPWLLAGLIVCGIPLIIHLLQKRRYRETEWAAMRFLLEAARKNSRRLRLEQLLLMLVRTLLLLCLVLAFAQPYVESFGTYLQGEIPTHRLLVVDASFSMGFRAAEFSRFDHAKEMATQIVSTAKRGDAMNLLRLSGSEPRTIVRQPAYQVAPVKDEIDNLTLTDERGDLLPTLRQLQELLDAAPRIPQKEIVVISDFQADTWLPASSSLRAEIRQILKQLSERTNLVLFDLGEDGAANVGIAQFSTDEPLVAAGRPVTYQVALKNYGVISALGQLLELYVDDRLSETRRVDLAPGADIVEEFTHTISAAAEHRLEARIAADSLPIDDRRWLALPVKSEIRVLLVNGVHAGSPEETATFYLEKALNPSTLEKPWTGIVQPDVVSESELTNVDLSQYDCVFLCNVRLIAQPEADVLTTFVKNGGGLIISLGSQVQAQSYNERLYRDSQGLLPAKLGDLVGALQAKDGFFLFDPGDLKHPVVSPFRGNPEAGLKTTMTFEYFRAVPPPEGRARIVLGFDSGDPAILDQSFGQGRVILVTTSLDARWSTWATLSVSFAPLMHELVLYAVSERWHDRQVLVGEPLVRRFSTPAYNMPVDIHLPNGTSRSIQPGEAMVLRFDATQHKGIYDVKLGPPLNRSELFAVNIDPRESDLRKLSEQELRKELLGGCEFAYRTAEWQESKLAAEATLVERGGGARWLLAATFCLLLVEQLMAWNFNYGLRLLCAVLALALVSYAFGAL